MEWWREIDNNIQLVRTISGINEMMDATQPPADQPVGTSQLALQGAENCLWPMVNGLLDMDEKMSYTIMLKLQVLARNNELSGYVTMGNGFKTLLTLGKNTSPLSYATRVMGLPTAQQKAAIMQMAQEAVTSNLQAGQGGMDPADFIELQQFIDMGGNMKLAAIMLRKSMDKARAAATADANARSQAQSQSAMQAADAAEKAKQATMQFQHDLDMKKLAAEIAGKIQEIRASGQVKNQSILVDKETDKRVNEHKAMLENVAPQ